MAPHQMTLESRGHDKAACKYNPGYYCNDSTHWLRTDAELDKWQSYWQREAFDIRGNGLERELEQERLDGVDEAAKEAIQTRRDRIGKELTVWWMEQAEHEVSATVPKAVEYGAADLEVMGTAMQHLIPSQARRRLGPENLRKLGLEMALAFYALGKVARLFGQYEQGEFAKDDTWHDLAVYTRMAQRVRQTGEWIPKDSLL